MKKDKLEQFIIDHRKDFDDQEIPEGLWDRIQKPSTKHYRSWKRWSMRIAAAVVIFAAAWFANDLSDQSRETLWAEDQEIPREDLEQYRLLLEAELFYTSRIKEAKTELSTLAGNNKSILQDINSDLDELDEVFEELKNDLRENGDNQEVIEAMIQNYRIKLEILEEMLRQMDQTVPQNQKSKEHEI